MGLWRGFSYCSTLSHHIIDKPILSFPLAASLFPLYLATNRGELALALFVVLVNAIIPQEGA